MKLHPWIMKQFKKKSRIYIMPTRMGGYLNGLIFLMFLLSVGYSNNLLLIFTLFLFGLNLIWVIQTHFHLHALKIDFINIHDGHALEKNQVDLNWKKVPLAPHKWQVTLEGKDSHPVTTIQDAELVTNGHVIFPKRGLWQFDYLKVVTEMPFGLYQAWIYYPVALKAYVYPARLKDMPIVNFLPASLEGENSSLQTGPHDIWNLGPYQGEESRKISWKHYARSGELVVKEGEELTQSLVQFRLDPHEKNNEFLLSKIATQMVQCARTETPFSLETPNKKFPPGQNEKHLTDCLRDLTVC